MPRSGASYSSEFEWREAAHWDGWKYDTEFVELDGEIQSAIIAHYRTHHQLASVITNEQAKQQRRQGRRGRRGT